MRNILFKYLLSLVFLMSAGGMINAQDLIVDHKTIGKLGDEITAALGAMSADNVKYFKVISTNKAFINPDDVRGMKTILQKIQNIDLSEVNCTLFDASAFQNYNSLISISLPILNGAAISKYMFKGCSNFREIKNWGNVRKIDEEAFFGCINFNATSFPETLEEIGKNAFKGCTGLTTSVLPPNIKNIGYQAFRESNVTFSEWPSSIQQIENRAFCITPVAFTTWPEHITTITPGVFINCNKIIKFIIPTSVTEVGGSAFRLSEKVNRNIYLSSVTPPITIADTDESGKGNKNPFSTDANTMTNQDNMTLYIPAEGKSLYKATDFWKKVPTIKTRALSSTILSGSWTKAELESMDISDANLTDIDMTGITVPADVVLSGAGNPNLLVYTKASDNITVDKGYVVKDGQIDNIALTDLKPFNPSKLISVGNISYNRPVSAAFETICLPFDAVVPVGYIIMELSGGTSEEVSLNKVSVMAANTPYMILRSVAETYSFSATSQVISNEMNVVKTEAPYNYKGTYLPMSVTAESGENIMYISDGTEFRLTGRGASILPFRAYLEGGVRSEATPAEFVKIANPVNVDEMGQPHNDVYSYSSNGILYLNSPKSQMLHIYAIDGRLVRAELLDEGENQVTGLNKGIYIIENRKFVVK